MGAAAIARIFRTVHADGESLDDTQIIVPSWPESVSNQIQRGRGDAINAEQGTTSDTTVSFEILTERHANCVQHEEITNSEEQSHSAQM